MNENMNGKSEESLWRKLDSHARSGAYPLHMPGHKRNPAFLPGGLSALDITEIPGFDDLHDMSGVLAETAALGARLYGAQAAFPLVNGSTGGILAAIRVASRRVTSAENGGVLICSRYSHRSVRNAADLCRLHIIEYAPPPDRTTGAIGSAQPDEIARLLDSAENVRAVVLTSPTYEGVISDVRAIANETKARGVPLIVDAAHGAHLCFSGATTNAARLGADAEIVSLHKTLPALTQSSLLLIGETSLLHADETARQLAVFQTSSPSYLLLASIDSCLRALDADAVRLFGAFAKTLETVRSRLLALKRLRLLDASDAFFAYDRSKILLSTLRADITGHELGSLLRGRGFDVETAGATHALAITSVADSRDALLRFADCVAEIDDRLGSADKPADTIVSPGVEFNK